MNNLNNLCDKWHNRTSQNNHWCYYSPVICIQSKLVSLEPDIQGKCNKIWLHPLNFGPLHKYVLTTMISLHNALALCFTFRYVEHLYCSLQRLNLPLPPRLCAFRPPSWVVGVSLRELSSAKLQLPVPILNESSCDIGEKKTNQQNIPAQ